MEARVPVTSVRSIGGRALGTILTIATSAAWIASVRPALAKGAATKVQCVHSSESGQEARKSGKLREARALFAECAVGACPRAVRTDCTEQLASVEAALPEVAFDLKGRDGAEIPSARITIDDAPLAAHDTGAFVPVDPGSHRVSFEADGFEPQEMTISLRAGEKQRRVSVVLRPSAPAEPSKPAGDRSPRDGGDRPSHDHDHDRDAPPPEPAEAPPVETVERPQAQARAPTPKSGGVGPVTYFAFGVGALGLVGASAFGVLALNDKKTLDAECNDFTCKASAQPDIDSMHTHALLSNVGWGVALAGIGVGALAWVFSGDTSSSPDAVRTLRIGPWVGSREAGLALTGAVR